MSVTSVSRARRRGLVAVLAAMTVMASSLASGSARASNGAEVQNDRVGSRAGFAASWQMLWQSDYELNRELDGMASTGAKWLRIDIDWPSIQPTSSSWNWGPTDRVVKGARARGIQVVGTLAFTPPWARGPGTDATYPPADYGNYARFAEAAVRRYKGSGVHHWEIWNEPNQKYWWGPKPDPWAYTSLLRRAYGAIKAADPRATVIGGGLAPAPDAADGDQINGETFVRRMYRAGAKGSFDALAMHPYSFPVEPTYPHPTNAFSYTTPAIHREMVANGDGGKKVWLTEFGAPTTGWRAVSEDDQGDFLVMAYDQAVRWPWAGPLFYYQYRDQSSDPNVENFGLRRRDWTVKKGWTAFLDEMAKRLP